MSGRKIDKKYLYREKSAPPLSFCHDDVSKIANLLLLRKGNLM
jgi:hypothetical protein